MMKIIALILIVLFAVAACVSPKPVKTETNINKGENKIKYQTVIFINIYLKSDEDFKAWVMKKIEGTNYIKPIRWHTTVRLHKTYIGWASVRYLEDGS